MKVEIQEDKKKSDTLVVLHQLCIFGADLQEISKINNKKENQQKVARKIEMGLLKVIEK